MNYRTLTANLAGQSRTALLAIYGAYRTPDGDPINADLFTALAVASLIRHNARAVALADLALAGVLSARRRRPVPVLGLGLPPDTPVRLGKAVSTLLEQQADLADPTLQIGRLGYAEPLDAGRDGYFEGMTAHGVARWTRVADDGACELCLSLADGATLPVTQQMYAHANCGCVADPID